ncbi:endolytic transglycosylase MltG [Nonomuraea soli]|uniref:Endolytic murein transglycosylase n=1 Tax=Nonomuraea soli TaxID=1032476 RepID=A0A7W0CQ36_9ACTN|nr:endolytic transglycosylase MltG [Nonomuraea soli]MBA2895172.1 UPF0755 protein [Nonomuraea soli]
MSERPADDDLTPEGEPSHDDGSGRAHNAARPTPGDPSGEDAPPAGASPADASGAGVTGEGTSDGGISDGGASDDAASGDVDPGVDARVGAAAGSGVPVAGPAASGGPVSAEGEDVALDTLLVTDPAPPKPKLGKGRAVLIGAGISVALLGGAGFLVARPYVSPADFEGGGEGAVTVHIPPGASASDVGERLADAGVVASARSFTDVALEKGKAESLHPGHYRLRQGMAAVAALDLLLSKDAKVVKRVTVREGMRLTEVLDTLAKATGLPLKDFQKSGVAPPYGKTLEGVLFPATYDVEPGTTAKGLVTAMVDRFRTAAADLRLHERAAALGLRPLEVLTVASIVQAEGGRDADYPKIARVIYNRLAAGTPLQLDTTVLYAQGRYTLRVLDRDTRVRSPYNTYLRPGLPPGPISNPGEKALNAALSPAEGDWFWFVTTDPAHRITKFTDKESVFVRYREELNENLGKD